jgi:hypothetical protein
MFRSGERANRGSQPRTALRTRRSIAAAAELHGLGADDASNGLTGEKPIKDIEADVPARSAHRYESTVDVVPKREPERLYSRQGIFCEPCLATPSGLPVRKPTSRAGRAKPWQDAGGRCARAAEMDQGDESRLEARDDKKLSTLGRYAVPKCGFLTTSLPPFQASRALWRVVWPSVRSVDAGPRRPRCWEAALCGLASSTNRPLAGTLGAFWVLKLGAMQGISGPWERRSGP